MDLENKTGLFPADEWETHTGQFFSEPFFCINFVQIAVSICAGFITLVKNQMRIDTFVCLDERLQDFFFAI